jgi:hypothetical protein
MQHAIVFLVATGSLFQTTAFSNAKHQSTVPLLFSIKQRDDDYTTKEQINRRRRRRNLDFWGVDMLSKSELHRTVPEFPSTFEDVAEQAFEAIAGTICGLQRPDPNVASNAMHSSVLDYRPTHSRYASIKRWNDGDEHTISKKDLEVPARMGIEIDGASFLLSKEHLQSDIKGTAEGRAMIIFSLELARRLVASPWNGFEDARSGLRSCAVFYNTMDQALMASRQLSRLKEEERTSKDMLEQIHISWLGQGSLPEHLGMKRAKKPANGLVLVVKPTDYDIDSPIRNIGRPTVYADCIEKLQRILFQASAASLPAIVISPRLTELAPLVQPVTTHTYKTGPWGHEQSNYQRSATYGGLEPPVGPTSWLLRDLIPPVYFWVACSLDIAGANTLRKRKLSKPSLRSLAASYRNQQQTETSEDQHFKGGARGADDGATEYSFYSRMAMTQTTMEMNHPFNIFAVEENASNEEWQSSYQFIGSSMASRGRPNSGIMKDIFAEWCDKHSDYTL